MPPRLQTLESQACAARGAFGFTEDEFEARYVPPARPGRVAAITLAALGALTALAHSLGWTSLIGSWRPGA